MTGGASDGEGGVRFGPEDTPSPVRPAGVPGIGAGPRDPGHGRLPWGLGVGGGHRIGPPIVAGFGDVRARWGSTMETGHARRDDGWLPLAALSKSFIDDCPTERPPRAVRNDDDVGTVDCSRYVLSWDRPMPRKDVPGMRATTGAVLLPGRSPDPAYWQGPYKSRRYCVFAVISRETRSPCRTVPRMSRCTPGSVIPAYRSPSWGMLAASAPLGTTDTFRPPKRSIRSGDATMIASASSAYSRNSLHQSYGTCSGR